IRGSELLTRPHQRREQRGPRLKQDNCNHVWTLVDTATWSVCSLANSCEPRNCKRVALFSRVKVVRTFHEPCEEFLILAVGIRRDSKSIFLPFGIIIDLNARGIHF